MRGGTLGTGNSGKWCMSTGDSRSGRIFGQPFFPAARRNCSSRSTCGIRVHTDMVHSKNIYNELDTHILGNKIVVDSKQSSVNAQGKRTTLLI